MVEILGKPAGGWRQNGPFRGTLTYKVHAERRQVSARPALALIHNENQPR